MSSLLNRRVPRPSAALLVAFVALFTALSGTGYAALLITGANVANGSLTGVDIENKSLGGKEMKDNTLKGTKINESTLGTVPTADHAATADNAAHATNADKAADADKLDGIDSAALMTVKPRVFESNAGTIDNFGNNATLGTLANLDGGQYLVTAKLTYDNDGVFEEEHCTLHVPGSDDSATFQVGNSETETIHLQEAVSNAGMWSASVSCTADPSDDMLGPLSIIAVRVD